MSPNSCFSNIWPPAALSFFTAGASLILSLITTFGNFCICLAVIVDPYQKLKTPFSYFLVNLALSDLLVGMVMLPVSVAVHFSEAQGTVQREAVYVLHMGFFISVTASVVSLAFLLIDRFVAITWPIKYRKRLSLPRCVLISISIWIFAVLISIPYFKVGYVTYLMVFVHTSVAITFIIVILTYVGVFRNIKQQTLNVKSSRVDVSEASRLKRERRVTRAFMWIVVLFISSYVPAIAMIFVLQFCDTCDCTIRHVLRDMQFVLICSNSAMNPFVCAFRLRIFRESIFAIVFRKRLISGNHRGMSLTSHHRSITLSSLGSSGNDEKSSPVSSQHEPIQQRKKIADREQKSRHKQDSPEIPKKGERIRHSIGILSHDNDAFEYQENALRPDSVILSDNEKETKL